MTRGASGDGGQSKGKNERGLSAPCPNYTFYFGRATPSRLVHILEIHAMFIHLAEVAGEVDRRRGRQETRSHRARSRRSFRQKEPCLTVITKKKKVGEHGPSKPRKCTRTVYIDVRDPKLSVSVGSERLVTRRDFFSLSLSPSTHDK